MAKIDAQKVNLKKVEKPVQRLNTLFNNFIDTLSGPNVKREREIERISNEIDDIIYADIKELTKFTGEDISTYLTKMLNDNDNASTNSMNSQPKNIEDMFSEDSGSGIFSFFNERYKNQNLLYEDLGVICSQLPDLKEAISTTRDAIVTSDDLSVSVSHSVNFKNYSGDDGDKKGLIDTVNNIQEKFDLLTKLKNHIIPNTLQYGKYYVYSVPYSKLFQQHLEKKQKREGYNRAVMESVTESTAKTFLDTHSLSLAEDSNVKDILKSFNDCIGNIHVFNEEVAIPVLEGVDLSPLLDTEFGKQVQGIIKATEKEKKDRATFADGTVEIKDKDKDFSGITECYVKLIDPRKIIPIKILEQTIGYYYIHQVDAAVSRSPFSQTVKSSFDMNQKDIESSFLSKITDKIVKAFNKEYLDENIKFKELILNALIHNDIYKREIKFQFIPVDYITEFHVNRNEDGEGVSSIMPALFYAKLYLALLIFKMITIITRSNDTKIYYVKQSGIDQNVSNKVNEIARGIKERQINFMDLLNYNSMVSKIGHSKDIFMPIGRSGEKGIDFDILAGQDVQLNTELMEMLKTSYVNSTGVPSVIMSFVNEADYAKTLVMANAKFVGRVVGYQLDFNKGVTELYRKILRFSGSIDPETVEGFEFKLLAPKALDNTNVSDLISNADQKFNFMVKALTGDQAEQSPEDAIVKDILYKKIAKDFIPSLPWTRAEELLEEARIEAQARKKPEDIATT